MTVASAMYSLGMVSVQSETYIVEVDYKSLTSANKGKINAFAELLKSIAE